MFTKGAVEKDIFIAESVKIFPGFSRKSSCFLTSVHMHTGCFCRAVPEVKLSSGLLLKNNASILCGPNCFPGCFTLSAFSKYDIDSQSSLDKQLF